MKLFEEFEEDLYYYSSKVLKDISNNLKKWFKKGMLASEENVNALYFEVMDKGLNPYTMTTFEVDSYRYDAYFLIALNELLDIEDKQKIDNLKITVQLKVYNEESEYLTSIKEDIKLKDLTEDFLLSKLSEIKDEIEDITED